MPGMHRICQERRSRFVPVVTLRCLTLPPKRWKCGRAMQDGVTSAGCAVLCPSVVALEDTATLQLTWPLGSGRVAKRGNPVNQRSTAARLHASDQEAVEELFNSCYPRLAGWVRRLVDDDEIAHEIASEAFTRLLSRWTAL